uniref:acireductone dioxygenase (Fe(2+)-requiring) n=1 Tax=Romanomermis culicivorax TaxID=13658 RepID=A0A915J5W8_ROMCU
MVHAWFMSNDVDDVHLPNKPINGQYIDLGYLKEIGVTYVKFKDSENYRIELKKFCDENGFNYTDECAVTERTPEDKIKKFIQEHIHSTDQVRYISDGSAFFDVRDLQDRWIRLAVEAGDLIVIPAGMYHRSVNDKKNYLMTIRIFPIEPTYDQFSRPAEHVMARSKYLQMISNKA